MNDNSIFFVGKYENFIQRKITGLRIFIANKTKFGFLHAYPKVKFTNIQKPVLKTYQAYDLWDCANYIRNKYDISIFDVYGKYCNARGLPKPIRMTEVPHYDFWYFLQEKLNISRPVLFSLHESMLCGISPNWVLEIFDLLKKEFGNDREEFIFFA